MHPALLPDPSILLVNYEGETDHFAGVEAALAARGDHREGGVARYTLRHVEEPFPNSVRVVAVKDTRTFLSIFALRQARRIGAAGILVMDGIVEYRNTYMNPLAGPDFLRPAPVDVVACAGETDRRLLEGFGNHAVATGLLRLAAAFPAPLPPPPRAGPVLIATANQPYFCDRERPRLLRSLVRLKSALDAARVPAIWRLTGNLERDLGLAPSPAPRRPLRDDLAAAAAVITTPSTVLVEAMLAGRPTALLHPHPTPCWQPAVWVWRGGEIGDHDLATGLNPASIPIAGAGELVQRLLSPSPPELARHAAALAELHTAHSPANALANLILEQLASPRRARRPVPLPKIERLPPPLPAPDPDRPRVVGCIRLRGVEPTPTFDAWRALAAAITSAPAGAGAHPDLHTLAVVDNPDAWNPYTSTLCADGRTHVCAIDPTAEPWRIIETIRAALERLAPAAIATELDDACIMASQLLRPAARTVALATPNDPGDAPAILAHFAPVDAAAPLSIGPGHLSPTTDALARLLAQPSSTTAPSDRPLRLRPGSTWLRTWTDDADAAEAWARERLAAAGFRSIAADRPAPGSDAVVLRADRARFSLREVERWRAAGIGVVAVPDLRSDFSPAATHAYAVAAAAADAGARRIAVFGIGAHTRRLRELFAMDLPFVGFIDDRPPQGGTLWGLPVVTLADAPERLSPDAVLLSSDAWEPQLWARCAPLRAAGVRTLALYGRYDTDPPTCQTPDRPHLAEAAAP